jgi:hypothetical protein
MVLSVPPVGGFNVSNLMGIKRRMIDVSIMTQKTFFLKNINMGIKKTLNFMLISNSLTPT